VIILLASASVSFVLAFLEWGAAATKRSGPLFAKQTLRYKELYPGPSNRIGNMGIKA